MFRRTGQQKRSTGSLQIVHKCYFGNALKVFLCCSSFHSLMLRPGSVHSTEFVWNNCTSETRWKKSCQRLLYLVLLQEEKRKKNGGHNLNFGRKRKRQTELFYIQKSQVTPPPVISLSITATRQWQKTALQRWVRRGSPTTRVRRFIEPGQSTRWDEGWMINGWMVGWVNLSVFALEGSAAVGELGTLLRE